MPKAKKKKNQLEETEKASEPDIARMLEWSNWDFKYVKVSDSKWEQMANASRKMESLRKNQKEMLKIKNTNRNEEYLW